MKDSHTPSIPRKSEMGIKGKPHLFGISCESAGRVSTVARCICPHCWESQSEHAKTIRTGLYARASHVRI